MAPKVKLGSNPKDSLGIKKVSISKLPAAGIIHGARAMMYGASKYGPYNWRDNAVVASIYYDAIMRHLMAWYDQREEVAQDSGCHHLGHILANCALLLDAIETGNLLDDRPHSGKAAKILERLNNELVGSIPDATGNSHSPSNAPDGHDEQPSYPVVLAGTATVVRTTRPPEELACLDPLPYNQQF